MILLHFVEQSAGHRAKAVAGHFVLTIAKTPERRIDSVLLHWPFCGAQ
jgi:hypothetical protein